MRNLLLFFSVTFLSSCATKQIYEPTHSHADAFFKVINEDGVWWLVDPDGRRFISKGVDNVQFASDIIQGTSRSPYAENNASKYGSVESWRRAIAARLKLWGFNTLGAWADDELSKINVDGQGLARTPILNLGKTFDNQSTEASRRVMFPDVFDPKFQAMAHSLAREKCGPYKDDPSVIGWFVDSELRWDPGRANKDELLVRFLSLPKQSWGRKAAIALLRKRYKSVLKFNLVWKTSFTSWETFVLAEGIPQPIETLSYRRNGDAIDERAKSFVADCDEFVSLVADKYFRITHDALAAACPNQLNLGAPFSHIPPNGVIAAAAKYTDIISFNCYENDANSKIERYSKFGKPLLISEFSFRAEDSGHPNTSGAGPTVKTQADRAHALAIYVTSAIKYPNLVGYHWFEHADQPKEGRFDGENSNYGLVNVEDRPYELLVYEMTRLNASAAQLHSMGNKDAPKSKF